MSTTISSAAPLQVFTLADKLLGLLKPSRLGAAGHVPLLLCCAGGAGLVSLVSSKSQPLLLHPCCVSPAAARLEGAFENEELLRWSPSAEARSAVPAAPAADPAVLARVRPAWPRLGGLLRSAVHGSVRAAAKLNCCHRCCCWHAIPQGCACLSCKHSPAPFINR